MLDEKITKTVKLSDLAPKGLLICRWIFCKNVD